MLDFMGLFYIIFSFFKILDIKGFSMSFRMYDPLAKQAPIYGYIYPFIEVILGMMFLIRFEVNIALILTLIVLGITTIGVTQTLINKRNIKCACLGTTLNLPMTEATFIENHDNNPNAHITSLTMILEVKPRHQPFFYLWLRKFSIHKMHQQHFQMNPMS